MTFHESDSQVRPSGPSDQTKKVPEKKQLNESDGTYEQIAVKLRRILSKTDICSETDVCYFSVSRKGRRFHYYFQEKQQKRDIV